MTSSVAAPAPPPLKAKAERGLIARVRDLLRRAVPRAEVIAQPEGHRRRGRVPGDRDLARRVSRHRLADAIVSAPAITLELHLEDAAAAFDPGERVAGVGRWAAPSFAPRGIELRLVWTLQGKSERDIRIDATVPLPDPQASERRPFFLTLPIAPYSFRGTLLALEWTLELVALPGEEKASVPLVLAPGRRAIDLVHRELRK